MSKRLIITEEEKKDIKSLYNINEQINFDSIIEYLGELLKNMGKKDISSYLNKTNSGSVDSKWDKITKKVIDEFEGGYWNPKCGHTTKGMGI